MESCEWPIQPPFAIHITAVEGRVNMCCLRGQTLCSVGPLTRLLYLKCWEWEKAAVVYTHCQHLLRQLGCVKLKSFKKKVCIWWILNRNLFFKVIFRMPVIMSVSSIPKSKWSSYRRCYKAHYRCIWHIVSHRTCFSTSSSFQGKGIIEVKLQYITQSTKPSDNLSVTDSWKRHIHTNARAKMCQHILWVLLDRNREWQW